MYKLISHVPNLYMKTSYNYNLKFKIDLFIANAN